MSKAQFSATRLLSLAIAIVITVFSLQASAAPRPFPVPQSSNGQTAQEQAKQIPGGVSKAKDGSKIMDMTVMINNLPIRFKVSAPADQFTTDFGGKQAPNTQGTMGANVLLHGDGGSSFFEFPNQNVQKNLMGVAVLAPDPNLFWGGGSGLDRTQGVPHSQAVADLMTKELPKVVAMNQSQMFFTGVSGGSLMLSGFFIPGQMSKFTGPGKDSGVMLNCGGMPPQVDFVDNDKVMGNTRMHFQSTKKELGLLQGAIPNAIKAYEGRARQAGLNNQQINKAMTVNNVPDGGHCEFDEKEFNSGVQLMMNSYANVMQGGNGQVNTIGNVNQGVVGNEKLQFSGKSRKRSEAVEEVEEVVSRDDDDDDVEGMVKKPEGFEPKRKERRDVELWTREEIEHVVKHPEREERKKSRGEEEAENENQSRSPEFEQRKFQRRSPVELWTRDEVENVVNDPEEGRTPPQPQEQNDKAEAPEPEQKRVQRRAVELWTRDEIEEVVRTPEREKRAPHKWTRREVEDIVENPEMYR